MLKKLIKVDTGKKTGKPRNLIKSVAIASGVIWVATMGAVFALKDISLAPSDTHAKQEPGPEKDGATALANVPAAAHDDHGGGAKHAGEEDHAHPAGDGNPGGHDGRDHAHEHPGHADVDQAGHDLSARKAAGEASGTEAVGHEKEETPETPAADHSPDDPGGKPAIMGPTTDDERDALRELAEIHASRGDLDKALKPLRRLMQDPGKDVALLSLSAEVFLGTGNYQEALAAARKALRHAPPGRVDLKVAAVMSQYRLGQVEGAMQAAQGYLKEHPKDLDLLTALGTMEVEMGPAHPHYGESLEKALHIKPKHVPALYQAGRKAQLEGDYKDAELAFRKVLRLEPRHAKAHGQLGTALYHLGREAEAREEFAAALELNPKDYNTWFNLGELHLSEAGKETKALRIRELRTKAMTCYLKAVEWNPDHAEAHFRAGVLLNGNGQFKEAIRHLEAARKVDARHVPTLIQLAVAYENLKRPERAKAYLERAFELDPLDKIVQFKLKRMT